MASSTTAIVLVFRRILHAWQSIQVELHGKYSVERMLQLMGYCRSSNLLHVCTVIVSTGVPCIVIALLLDCIPLQPPSTGIQHSQMFWLRVFTMATLIFATVLVQLRQFIPKFPITLPQIVGNSIVNSALATAFAFAVSWRVGFPLPSTVAVGGPAGMVGFAGLFGIGWGRFTMRHPDVRAELLRYVVVLTTQLSLIYVYPSFSYVFKSLSPTGQSAFSLILPLPKIAFKNWICYTARNKEDFKPQVAIFNIEIFHALFSWLSLHDVGLAVKRLGELLNDSPASLECSGYTCKARSRGPSVVTPIELQSNQAVSAEATPTVLDIAQYILEQYKDVKRDASIRVESEAHETSEPTNFGTSVVPEYVLSPAATGPSIAGLLKKIGPLTQSGTSISRMRDLDKQAVGAMSDAERLEYVQQVLQLLHLTEFVLLVEFTEVIIPIGYSVYLLVAFQLPNREYCSALKDVDGEQLQHNILTILVYASLELLSFVVLAQLLWRKLRISAIHQLAFVLETQWRMIQSKLVLWFVFSMQVMVEHFGSDYSFQFQWLHHTPSPA